MAHSQYFGKGTSLSPREESAQFSILAHILSCPITLFHHSLLFIRPSLKTLKYNHFRSSFPNEVSHRTYIKQICMLSLMNLSIVTMVPAKNIEK